MIVYPAIDLQAGNCVRLYKGDFNNVTLYKQKPQEVLANFAKAGSQWVHIVDLDGAKAGTLLQRGLLAKLAKETNLKIEFGGGIRNSTDLTALFAAGAARAVVGSVCVSNPQLVKEWFNYFGADKIVLALDCSLDQNQIAKVRTHGWQQESIQDVFHVLAHYPQAKYVLCTDIAVDGTLAGPNIALYQQIQLHYPNINLIASGGIGKLADLVQLKKIGIHGVVIGKALYENQFSLEEALEICS